MKRGKCREGSGTAELSAPDRPADTEEVFKVDAGLAQLRIRTKQLREPGAWV
jgi:hypothetical protein